MACPAKTIGGKQMGALAVSERIAVEAFEPYQLVAGGARAGLTSMKPEPAQCPEHRLVGPRGDVRGRRVTDRCGYGVVQ